MNISTVWTLQTRTADNEAWSPDTTSSDEAAARDNHFAAAERLPEGTQYRTLRTELHEVVESW